MASVLYFIRDKTTLTVLSTNDNASFVKLLAPERYGNDFKCMIYKLIIQSSNSI